MPRNLTFVRWLAFVWPLIWSYQWTKLDLSLVSEITMFGIVNILRIVLHKMEHFNFWWSKIQCTCQDGACAADTRWSLVGRNTWLWVGIRSSIVRYVYSMTLSKYWSITISCVNCVLSILIFQRGFKRREIFFVAKREYEGSWSLFPDTSTCYNVKIMFW
jgi:hypothetical protein